MRISNKFKRSGIYCIINIKNNKKYIGSSINITRRLSSHRAYLRSNSHINRILQNAWNKYTSQCFECYVLEFCNEDLLLEREQFYIDQLNPEYNITKLVERNILSLESRRLISKTRKERIKSGEIKLYQEKQIHRYDLNGNYIDSFKSIKIASKECNIHQSTIHRFLNGTYKKGGGYLWSLEFKDKLEPYVKKVNNLSKSNKKVKLIDCNTLETVYKFNSLKECAEYFNTFGSSISHAIKVQQKFKKKYFIQYDLPVKEVIL